MAMLKHFLKMNFIQLIVVELVDYSFYIFSEIINYFIRMIHFYLFNHSIVIQSFLMVSVLRMYLSLHRIEHLLVEPEIYMHVIFDLICIDVGQFDIGFIYLDTYQPV